jgi:uncharacterized membrane protein
MTTIEKSVDVHAPVSTVYNQWTQFESFPTFMEGVERIVQVTPTMTHWETNIGGVRREFDAQITEQHPDERIAWRSVEGPGHGGVVTFHRLDNEVTRVNLEMEYEPETFTEKAGAALGAVGNRVSGDLKRFKAFIEQRDQETGAWRGEVPRHEQQGGRGTPGGRMANPDRPGPNVPPAMPGEPRNRPDAGYAPPR